jgi:hypothetical protein
VTTPLMTFKDTVIIFPDRHPAELMGRTDKRQVSKNSPRRNALSALSLATLIDGLKKAKPDIPPVTERTGPRQAFIRRIVPLTHNHGDPIVKSRLPPELRKEIRRAAKKAKRKALCDKQNRPSVTSPQVTSAASHRRENPVPPPALD